VPQLSGGWGGQEWGGVAVRGTVIERSKKKHSERAGPNCGGQGQERGREHMGPLERRKKSPNAMKKKERYDVTGEGGGGAYPLV